MTHEHTESRFGTPSRRSMLGGASLAALAATAAPPAAQAATSRSGHAAAAATSPSGQAMPVGNITGWKQVIAEDFATYIAVGGFVGSTTRYGELATNCAAYAAYGKRLGVYPTGAVAGGGMYSPEKTISTSGSLLDIYLHVDTALKKPVSGAFWPVRPGSDTNAHQYGRWAYRMRSYQATGVNWGCVSEMWPDDDNAWPGSGEIDWPEGNVHSATTDTTGTLKGYFHPKGSTKVDFGKQQKDIPALNGVWANWHTFIIEWLPNSFKAYMDTHLVFSTTQNVPDAVMRWVTQSGPNDPGLAPPSGSAHVQLDWVVAYDPA